MRKNNNLSGGYQSRFEQILGKDIQNIDIKFFKAYVFLPDFVLHYGTYVAKKTFVRHTATDNGIKDSISFHFYNVFDSSIKIKSKKSGKQANEHPYVRIFPVRLSQKIPFKKNMQITQLSIGISADYLKSFLKEDANHFRFLLDSSNTFLIEEIMSDDILRTVNAIVIKEQPAALKSYHYKLKAMELLFYLFQSLSKREKPVYGKLNESDIQSIYKVRDKIVSSLDKPTAITTLKQIAGMNELKMRKIFSQIFGMGIYDYFQRFRMKEAARLLREEKLSVSETGYRMGFENLSHFSRVFEKHIGTKPKKYSKEMT